MKRQTKSFTGQRPIFTGSVAIVPGGFNLDTQKQRFTENMVIPGGVCAIMDEQTRKVSVVKTAKVSAVDSDNSKIVYLHVDEFFAPIFAVGDRVAKDGSISGTYAAAVSIEKIEQTDTTFVITLSGAISCRCDSRHNAIRSLRKTCASCFRFTERRYRHVLEEQS